MNTVVDNVSIQNASDPMVAEHGVCFHCQLPVTDGAEYSLNIKGQDKTMCCPGCVAAAQMIVDNNLTHYYEYRKICDINELPIERVSVSEVKQREFQAWSKPDYRTKYCHESEYGTEAEVIISGIRCAACVWLLEKYLSSIEGIDKVTVNLANHRCYIQFNEQTVTLVELFEIIASLGYQPYPFVASFEEELFQSERRSMLKALGVSAFGVMQVMMFTIALYAGAFEGIEPVYELLLQWSSLVIATPIALYSARIFYVNAWRDLKQKKAGMDLPVSLAIIAAYGASLVNTVWLGGEVYFESVAMFVFFLLLSRFIELNARRQQAMSTNELVSVFPDYAIRIEKDKPETVLLSELNVGDKVLVENGAKVPTDGVIVQGETLIDESAFSGESLPLKRNVGEKVFAGSINVQNPIELEVTAQTENSLLSNMVRLTERAAADKPPIAMLADRIAGYFVMIVLLTAFVAWIYWQSVEPSQALEVVLAVLVVSCPCALSLATPVALSVGNKSLLLNGLMPTTGRLLSGLAEVDTVLFDKTGTLTSGKVDLVDVLPCSTLGVKQMISLAGSLEQGVNHPLAKVLRQQRQSLAQEHKVTVSFDKVTVTQGGGVIGKVGTDVYRIGSREFVTEARVSLSSYESDSFEGIKVYLSKNAQLLGVFIFSDCPKLDASKTITKLKQLGMELHIVSGDNEANCAFIAQQLGIENHTAKMKPEDKINYLKDKINAEKKVLMIGDGINDAAALKQAHVSLAINDACEFVQAKTDGVMLNSKLWQIIRGLELAQKTKTTIRQNITWALLYNLSALPLAAIGLIPPWVAALGMSLSSLLVLINSWRINLADKGQLS